MIFLILPSLIGIIFGLAFLAIVPFITKISINDNRILGTKTVLFLYVCGTCVLFNGILALKTIMDLI